MAQRRLPSLSTRASQPFSGGEVIVEQGGASEDLYIVTRGTCAIRRTLTDVAATPARKVTLHINTLHRGEIFGEIGVIRAIPRTASVVAIHSGEVLSISRIELSRIFSVCPELRDNLERAVADHPSDADHLQAWKYDTAWASYRKALHAQLTERGGARGSEGRRHGDGNLPAFDTQRHQPPQDMRSRQLTSSQMFPWANDYLDEKVLPNLADLIVDEPEPPPYVPAADVRVARHTS